MAKNHYWQIQIFLENHAVQISFWNPILFAICTFSKLCRYTCTCIHVYRGMQRSVQQCSCVANRFKASCVC
jgi:hypothetical protein